MADDMEDIIQDFLIETKEILDGLDQKFVGLEKEKDNQQLLNDIFRSVHTIKGASGFLGFSQLVEVTHATENILKRLRDRQMKASPEIMDEILHAVDMMKILIEHIRNKDSVEEDISGIVGNLEEIINRHQSVAANELPEEAIEQPEPCGPQFGSPQEYQSNNPKVSGDLEESISISTGLDEGVVKGQVSIDSETATEQQTLVMREEPEEGLSSSDDFRPALDALSQPSPNEKSAQVDQTIRVDVQKLDDVLNLVGELVLGRNRLIRIATNLEITHSDDPEVSALTEACSFINLITTDLQLAVMKTRMQPIKKVFNRFPRMVRDLARAKGKEVKLQVFGEETELDKSVIEEIGDPLVHLIRNALDHGIESPEERKKAGKSPVGSIRLSAFQEGNNILLKIEDDGKGIDPDVIRLKALEKRLMSPSDVKKLSDKDALDLIFMPGFSTAKEISDISGRGVGMDVVRTNVARLNGHIDIKTQQVKGTEFIIRLPLTLAIIQALMVEIGAETFAIPLSIVVETVRVNKSELKTIDSQEAMVLRGQVLSLVRLGREFDIISTNGSSKVYVVIVALGEKKFGLIVDQLLGQEEVVIKSIEGKYGTSEGIAGATITGDGRVVLILDVARIMDALLNYTAASV